MVISLRQLALQHRHNGVAWFTFAGLVDGDDTVFPFLAACLVVEHGFGIHRHARAGPWTFGLLAALYLVCGDFAAVNGRFPVEGNPAYTFAWRIPLPSLRSS
jgi:hypothetical protein